MTKPNKSIETKLIMTIAIIFILSSIGVAVNFQTVHNPFTRELDYYVDSSDLSGNIVVENLTATNITATGFISGNSTWVHQGYPAACSSGYVITALGDTVTCTQQTINGDTDKAIASINMTSYNITMETGIIYHNGTGIIIS